MVVRGTVRRGIPFDPARVLPKAPDDQVALPVGEGRWREAVERERERDCAETCLEAVRPGDAPTRWMCRDPAQQSRRGTGRVPALARGECGGHEDRQLLAAVQLPDPLRIGWRGTVVDF